MLEAAYKAITSVKEIHLWCGCSLLRSVRLAVLEKAENPSSRSLPPARYHPPDKSGPVV